MVVSLAALFDAQAGRCWYCAEPMHQSQGRGHSTTRDHLLPKSRGGANARSNIVGACGRCNGNYTFKKPESIGCCLSVI